MKKIGWKVLIKRIFPLPFWADVLSFTVCGAALIRVFQTGLEAWYPVYFLYALSAYLLTSLCVKLPGCIIRGKRRITHHPRLYAALRNRGLMFKLELYVEQLINFAYGIFKILSGAVIGSAWIGCDGLYNFTYALIQLFQILRRRNPGSIRDQWKSYRFCGMLIFLMHLTLIGIVFQMLNRNGTEAQSEITVIATAAFAFYKFVSSFLDLAKDRKHTHPIDSSVRMLKLSHAVFAIFSLQSGLLQTFGTGENWEHLLNLATGCAVCLSVSATGIYMIRRSNRELKIIQENENE